MGKKLHADEIRSAVRGWNLQGEPSDGGRIEKEFKFKTFPEAFSFMTRVAFEAEAVNHHPDWSNSYNRVKVALTTHDAGGVTEKDLELARRIDAIDWS